MRVLLLNYEYPPYGGGAGVATEALARTLASRGVTVDVVTAGEEPSCESRCCGTGRRRRKAVLNVHRVRCRRTSVHEAGMGDAASYLVAALPLVRRLLSTEQYDAAHFFFSLPTGAMIPFLNLGKTPVVVSLRGSDVPGYDSHNHKLERAHRVLHPLLAGSGVVPIASCRCARVSAAWRCGPCPTSTTPSCRTAWTSPFRSAGTQRAGRRPGPVRCLAVARLVERKGLDHLIRAIASLERGRYELEIVGTGPDEHSLRELAARFGLDGFVKFSGSLDRDRWRAAIARPISSRSPRSRRRSATSSPKRWRPVFRSWAATSEAFRSSSSTAATASWFLRGIRLALAAAILSSARIRRSARRWAGEPCRRGSHLSWDRIGTRYLSLYHGIRGRVPARSRLAELPSSSW